MLLKAYQDFPVGEEKFTTAKRVTSSISCAQKIFDDEETGGNSCDSSVRT
jgi:hypothetical protein